MVPCDRVAKAVCGLEAIYGAVDELLLDSSASRLGRRRVGYDASNDFFRLWQDP